MCYCKTGEHTVLLYLSAENKSFITDMANWKKWPILFFCSIPYEHQGPLLLTWFNFNPSMDKKSHAQWSVEWNYLSIPKLQRCNRLCTLCYCALLSLHWRHNDQDGVSNHQPHRCLLNRLFRRRENIKAPRHWPLCGEFTGTGEFPTQRASYAENVSIWWRHHVSCMMFTYGLMWFIHRW